MFNYLMSPTGKEFHECDKFVKMICGPYGSGKSCCCAVDILSYACAQAPAPDGVRYSHVGVIRSTYPELTRTTRKSLMEVLPRECGDITGVVAPLRGLYTIPLQDGTTVHLEFTLVALKTADDCSKILSANWTFAWINEATGCAPEVFTSVMSRVGRFPSQDMGGISWGGIIMDFNQPAPGTWLDEYMKNPADNWAIFRQPPAAIKLFDKDGQPYYEVNPEAENLRNLGSKEEGDPEDMQPEERGKRYYRNQIDTLLKAGRIDIVDNQYCMLEVPIVDGKPVYASFSTKRHVAPNKLEPKQFVDTIIGIDQSGVHPAAVVLQNQYGKWCVLDELYAENEGFEDFIYGMLVPLIRAKYATCNITAAIDPSNQRDSWTAVTPSERLEEAGITAMMNFTNNPKIRIQNVEHILNMETGGLIVSPACELLIRGFMSEYRYRRLRAAGSIGAAYTPQPEKNEASHVHDALQYAMLLIYQNRDRNDDTAKRVVQRLSNERRVLGRVI